MSPLSPDVLVAQRLLVCHERTFNFIMFLRSPHGKHHDSSAGVLQTSNSDDIQMLIANPWQ